MPEIGQSLSHYSITEKLGKGGMGEVFRAKDQKLGRDVAIKVLPEEFARDADRIARFQREAKLLASLNHPNIAAIHGLEESGGTQFLVLELVEGDTLADQIKRGPITVEESLKQALQIAEALEAAHEKGVIHRDLKPANIKVTPDGKVKVLDFGLAKAFAGDQGQVNLSNSPTLSDMATQQGVILGTAAYMSPEQARAKAVDKRTDIWAFAVVLFEMLTGRQVFTGETVSDTMASVLAREPEWSSLPLNLHPRIRLLLERCLEKDAKNRYHDIADVRVDIQKVLADPSGILMQQIATAKPRTRLRMGLPWVAAAVVLAALVVGVAVWRFKPTEPREVMRFDYSLPEGRQFSDLGYPAIAVSPDGKRIVYSTPEGLYLRSENELTAKLIAGTEGGTTNPFFSPDGKWIGYYSAKDHKLKKIVVSGGAPVALCDVVNLRGAWWDESNAIIYSQFNSDIMRISADGGTPESIVKLKSGELGAPQILPDGKSILYTSDLLSGQSKIVVQSLKSRESKELFTGSGARYLPTGHIIYQVPDNKSLLAVAFNLDRLEVEAGAVPVLEGVGQHAVSDSGTLAYIPEASSAFPKSLVWVSRDGKEEPLPVPPNDYAFFRISPDGKRVALQAMATKMYNVWIWDIAREAMMRLTLDEASSNLIPLWTPDGKRIVYAFDRENKFGMGDIYWKAADGTGEAEKLASSPGRGLFPWSWSKDGKSLALWEFTLSSIQGDIGLLSMEGDHARTPLLQAKYSEHDPRISHDGRWMAYSSNESGKMEVYVRPFPEVNTGKWQVSTNGGNSPLWSPNDRELYYRSGDAVMVTSVEIEPAFKPGKSAVLFRRSFPGIRGVEAADIALWDISPDGKRFLMLRAAAAGDPRKINIVLNWFEELKQRVPTK